MSSFGDFIALSDVCDYDTAMIINSEVSDGIIAPGYEVEALEILKNKRKGTYTVIQIDPSYEAPELEKKEVFGITFEQERNNLKVNFDMLENIVTTKKELPENVNCLARKIGILAARLSEKGGGPIGKCSITLRGNVLCDEDGPCNKLRPYTVAAIKGMLEVTHGPDVNYMIAPMLAQERGIAIEEGTGESRTYKNVIEIEVEAQNATIKIVGTITEEGRQHVVRMNDYWIDFVPHGQLLIFQNHDRPGVIGRIGKLLGDVEVNIANFSLGRKDCFFSVFMLNPFFS